MDIEYAPRDAPATDGRTPVVAPGCSFCAEIHDPALGLHREVIPGSPTRRILAESAHWLLVPTIGALAPGHLLIVSREHYPACLHAPLEARRELERFLASVAERLRELYSGPVVCFEHGESAGSLKGRSGSCIDHAHLHVVPAPPSFVSHLTGRGTGWRRVESFAASGASASDGHAYLLAGELFPRNRIFIREAPGVVPPQLLRRVLSSELHTGQSWNWRIHPQPENFLQTIIDWADPRVGDSRSDPVSL